MDTEYYYDFVTMAPIFEYTVYDDDTREMKVVFDTHEDGDCVEYGRENIWGVFEWDIDVATDEEIKDLLEVK